MSGFGNSGGFFGSGSNNPLPFGSSGNPQQASMFGGAAPTPAFGQPSAPPAQPTFGQPGFGATPMTQPAFGAPAPTTFGAGFGATTTPSAPSGFGTAPTTGFGTGPSVAPPATSNPFGSSAPAPSAFSGGFGQSSSIAAAAPPAAPFGQHPPPPAPSFGTNTPFGNTVAPATTSAPPFGQVAAPTVAPNPFGNVPSTTTTTAPSTFSFGFSSNVAAAQPSPSGFGMQQQPPQQFGSTPFGNTALTFTTSSSTPPFGQTGISSPNPFEASDDDMGTGGGGDGDDSDMGDATSSSATTTFRTASPFAKQARHSPRDASSQRQQDDDDDDNDDNKNQKLRELAKMKKELEEKKKKLLEKKKKREGGDATTTTTTTTTTFSRSTSPVDTQAMAARNAVRFGTSSSSSRASSPNNNRVRLPPSLQTSRAGDDDEGDDDADEPVDLRDAVALVGTCQYMCPDDELKQRTEENDIKLLETPLPGQLHPPDWTLRNTAVKRFRRSAADYKLNVPEWVRDADVLERTVSYLEEWVMERDRQGPDPRFVNQPHPPSLDVYQFIWNRTRMIRKDFILQNYVGTGGLCDARAVRCHERIARWHAMCEHQLSHIPDFVKAQSQQNIAELGQAMKTLNQFYDDTMGRSTVEVPDEHGKETRKDDWKGPIHGCEHATVQGVSPVDFNGKPLRNDESAVSKRIVGVSSGSSSHGTAEPEMRALYILLTVDNDGGMEVLRYAANLSREKPHVFYSGPVQLAMKVFKAKHEFNYAAFFAILRAPTTPYLMACLMFKHVEEMRKVAFRIMSRTYGYKRSGDGPEGAQYDQYQLERLVRLLNFENNQEAREACKFYNITVKEQKVKSRSATGGVAVVELVFWRHSRFAEPKDENKGITLSLKPWKMTRTIESKLQGATRLAVCRGEVSGDGASLPADQVKPLSLYLSQPMGGSGLGTAGTAIPSAAEQAKILEAAKAKARETEKLRLQQEAERRQRLQAEREALQEQQEKEKAARLEDEKRRRAAEAEKARQLAFLEEQKRKEEERKRQEAAAKAAAEAAKQRRRAEEERKRKEAEERKAREVERERREEEERRRLEEEAKRKAEEEERRRLEAERERQRQEEERRRRAAEAAEKRRREEEERRRLELLRKQQEAAEAERRRKRAEARRIAAEWQRKMDAARKVLLWRRLKKVCEPQLRQERSRLSLESLDPTRFVDVAPVTIPDVSYMETSRDENTSVNMNQFLDFLCRGERSPIDFNKMLCDRLLRGESVNGTDLFKVGVVVPRVGEGVQAESLFDLLHKWVGQRLQYDQILSGGQSEPPFHMVRSMVARGSSEKSYSGVDMVVLVVPPFANGQEATVADLTSALRAVPQHVPIVALNLNASSDAKCQEIIDKTDAQHVVSLGGDDDSDFDGALHTAMNLVAEQLSENSRDNRLVPVLVRTLVCKCIDHAFSDGPSDGCDLPSVLHRARSTLEPLLKALEATADRYAPRMWPSAAFANADGAIENYFGPNSHLPAHSWHETLRRRHVEPCIELADYLLQKPLPSLLEILLENAPLLVASHCQSLMTARMYSSCLTEAFQWWPRQEDDAGPIVFLPNGMVDEIVNYVGQELAQSASANATPRETVVDFSLTTTDNVERAAATDGSVYTEIDAVMNGGDGGGKLTIPTGTSEAESGDWLHSSPQGRHPTAADEGILARSKRALDSANDVLMGSPWKKRRPTGVSSSTAVNASKAFTARLEALLGDGEAMIGRASMRGSPRIGLTSP